RRRHTRFSRDWSSDVCSSDLEGNRAVEERVLSDLERLYPGQIRGNAVTRRFLHTREGIIACRPGSWQCRPPQYIGLRGLVLAGRSEERRVGKEWRSGGSRGA